MSNSDFLKLVIIFCSLLFLSGCYNNSHVRTQRLIKKDEPVISGHMEINVLSPDFHSALDVEHSGVSGLRMGMSYLGMHQGFEQGVNVGIGLMDDATDLILGYDIRKPIINGGSRPYRLGLYVETNYFEDTDNYGLMGGTVFQIRPYINSITSDKENWYAGFHGLMSFGTLNSSGYYYDWTNSSNNSIEYDASAMGLGITLGKEFQTGKFILQSQIDASILNQVHTIKNQSDTGEQLLGRQQNATGLTVTLGFAVHLAPGNSASKMRGPTSIYPSTASEKSGSYDPFTGKFIPSTKIEGPNTYDPMTGEVIPKLEKRIFDPYTGENVTLEEVLAPLSLLSKRDQSTLMIKKLFIVSLNGSPVKAQLLDVTAQGLLILREFPGNTSQEMLSYDRIKKVRFQGPRKGLKGGLIGAFTGCSLGLVLPLGATLITTDSDMMFLSIIGVPVGVLGGLVYGSVARDSYELELIKKSDGKTDTEKSKRLVQKLISMYLENGFPTYDLNKVVKP